MSAPGEERTLWHLVDCPKPNGVPDPSRRSTLQALDRTNIAVSNSAMDDGSYPSTAKRQIGETAASMLAGAISYLEGARVIADLGWKADIRDDPDIIPFVGLESETDDLPLGNVQLLWSAEALRGLRPKIEQYEMSAKQDLAEHCQRLVQRFCACQ
jgi:hypothetical protein